MAPAAVMGRRGRHRGHHRGRRGSCRRAPESGETAACSWGGLTTMCVPITASCGLLPVPPSHRPTPIRPCLLPAVTGPMQVIHPPRSTIHPKTNPACLQEPGIDAAKERQSATFSELDVAEPGAGVATRPVGSLGDLSPARGTGRPTGAPSKPATTVGYVSERMIPKSHITSQTLSALRFFPMRKTALPPPPQEPLWAPVCPGSMARAAPAANWAPFS